MPDQSPTLTPRYLSHKPSRWPQCFPAGPDDDATCIGATMRRIGKKAAGALLDGREWREMPR